MNPSLDQLNDYTHYLQSQVQKFTAFMISQKKLNQKHLQVESSIDRILDKVTKAEEKVKLLEVNQKDSLLELRKIRAEKEAVKVMEMRLENIERELSSILKLDSNRSFEYVSEQGSVNERSGYKSQRKKQKIQDISPKINHQDLEQLEKYFTELFVNRQEVQSIVNRTKDDLDFRIKKLQVQIDKSKESFLKLANHINSLSINFSHENTSKKQLKNQNRTGTQSTKDLNTEPFNQQNIVTKKQLRKMQKKLQNFFSQKLSQIVAKNQTQTQGFTAQKALKFKKIQQKFDKMTLEQANQRQTRSEGKIQLSNRQYSSQKKIPLFDNQVLKERHMNAIHDSQRKKRKSQSRSIKDSPIGILESQNNGKQKRNQNSRSQLKRFGKKRSPQRLNKVNLDYMMK